MSVIIGNGQLAKSFQNYSDESVLIFASGVSNSNCTDEEQFKREKILLIDALNANKDKKFIYFSSCALSADEYPKNDYYKHKVNMETIIKEYSTNYYIFRLPQLFGDLILHKTLINFIYKSIEHNHKFHIYDEAYRYVIEINDVRKIVEAYLTHHDSCMTVDLANPYRYNVLDIVQTFEKLLKKRANYEVVQKEDKYILDFSQMKKFIEENGINMKFGGDYLERKLKGKIQ